MSSDPQAPAVVEFTEADIDAARSAWNAIADEFNRWDVLSLEETVSWITNFARHRLSTQSAMQSRIEELRRYAQHLPVCKLKMRMGDPCECGLNELRATLSNIPGGGQGNE